MARISMSVLGLIALGCTMDLDGSMPSEIEPAPDEDAAARPYPIVLCHGFGGFDDVAGYEYFFGVKDYLRAQGYEVYVTEVPQFASIATRAATLAPQIDAILEESQAAKVNLIGHSQGGLDSRYLVASLGYAPVVASVTTIATPHAGTSIADLAMESGGEAADDLRSELLKIFGAGGDMEAALSDITTSNMRDVFNVENPDQQGVAYFSFGGICTLFIDPTGKEDTCDLELSLAHSYLSEAEGPNDGLCGEASARWGTYLGAVTADHLDQIGQLAGITSPAFDHLAFYAGLADFLAGQGS